MKAPALRDHFHSWLLSTYNDPEFSGKIHCFAARKQVALAPGDVVDFLSIRHERPIEPEERGLFSVGLWKFTVGAVTLDAVNKLCRQLQSFRSGCAEALSRLNIAGETPVHRVGVHGNLVGACVSPDPAIAFLSNGFGDLSFWTYREGVNRIDVEPHYDEASSSRSPARFFQSLLARPGCDEETARRKRPRALSTA